MTQGSVPPCVFAPEVETGLIEGAVNLDPRLAGAVELQLGSEDRR